MQFNKLFFFVKFNNSKLMKLYNNKFDKTPLSVAVQYKNVEIVKLLLTKDNIDVNMLSIS